MTPTRIQMTRRAPWRRHHPTAVIVDRRTKFGNPHHVGTPCQHCGPGVVHTHAQAVALYRQHLRDHPELVDAIRAELHGRDLACWCKPEDECHADVLLAVAAGGEP